MAPSFPILKLVRRIGFLAILGFLAIHLIGPVLALLSVVLCFAFIGFLFWLPFHLLTPERSSNWWVATRCLVARTAGTVPGTCLQLLQATAAVRDTIRRAARTTGVFLLETLSGALVGLLLVVPSAGSMQLDEPTAATAALAGAVVGAAVVLSRPRHVRHVPLEQ